MFEQGAMILNSVMISASRYLDKAISLQEADSTALTELGRYYDQF